MYNDNIWEIKTCDDKLARELSIKLNISPLIAALLVQRGINTYEEARYFFYGDLNDLVDPFLLPGVDTAVRRIQEAVEGQEKVIIYGDYDVDGICSIVLLKQCLDRIGVMADYYVPDRFSEGYGLNIEAVERLASKGYNLLITVDCGITSINEVAIAKNLGIDVIITDHHTPLTDLPEALVVINPKLGSPQELGDLCGAAVVFKLCQALCPDYVQEKKSCWLELVALAIVADVVALKGENRILVKSGLARIPQTSNIGLQELIKETNLSGKKLSSWHIGFILAPRLNSAGRLYNARRSIELLLCNDPEKAHEMAVFLCNINSERKMIEEKVFKEAEEQMQQEQILDDKVLILAGESWHQGITGIVASRLCEKYRRPAILISWNQELGRGSCRSLPGINIYNALLACSSHMLHFGGHSAAAGLSIRKNSFKEFCQAVREWAEVNISEEQMRPHLYAEAELEPGDITENLLQELAKLEPFGEGNPSPRFVIRGAGIESTALIGKQKEHFRAHLGNKGVEIIAFNRADLIKSPVDYCLHDILFEIGENEYLGKKKLQLKLADMKNSISLDIPKADYESDQKLLKALNCSLEEIRSGRPVIFIYPTYRTLVKQRLFMRSFFRIPVLRELHGHISSMEKYQMINEFSRGVNRVFMVTTAFLKYYLKKHALSPKLNYIFFIYSDRLINVLNSKYPDITIETMQKEIEQPVLLGPADLFQHNRVLLYANRNSTMQSINTGKDCINIEAGINDIRHRKAIRQKFMQNGGILLSDGANTSFTGLDNVKVFFADAPYSIYEMQMVLDQLAAGTEREGRILFDQADLEFNRKYIQRIYPGIELIKNILSYFKTAPKNKLTTTISDLVSSIKSYLALDIKPQEITSALEIMADLDLCQFEKKGSIMAIKFLEYGKTSVNIKDSSYYMEGQAEKTEFNHFERFLENVLIGD